MNSWLGWRKFLVTLAAHLGSTALLLAHILTGEQWVSFNQIVIPAFLTANLIEYFSKRGPANASPTSPDSE